MLDITPKAATEKASSMPVTAKIRVGIPLATPKPLSRSLSNPGTTTAGETAASIELKN
jgi:hypothetical protein